MDLQSQAQAIGPSKGPETELPMYCTVLQLGDAGDAEESMYVDWTTLVLGLALPCTFAEVCAALVFGTLVPIVYNLWYPLDLDPKGNPSER